MKRILTTCLFCLLMTTFAYAQGPKWVSKAGKSVITVTTFDKEGALLKTGNGFFISEDGVAVSDFSLFKGAYKAIAINTDGRELAVESILGADDTYDIVKFRVDTSNSKKIQVAAFNTSLIEVGDEVYVLPYSVEKSRSCLPGKVKKVDTITDGLSYLTLDIRMSETLVSCPVMNTKGEVLGILQRPFGTSDGMTSHVLDIRFIEALQVGALSSADYALNDIHIKKGLPSTEEQALVYLYMTKQYVSSAQYEELLGDFIKQFPNSIEGYFMRAQHRLAFAEKREDIRQVEVDLDQAKSVATDQADLAFRLARLIMSSQDNELLTNEKGWSIDDALQQIDQALDKQADMAIYWQVKAEVLTMLERYDEAYACYEVVNKSEIASPSSYYNASLVKQAQGADLTEVVALMDSCINLIPKPYNIQSAPYLYQRALLLNEMGKHREALIDMKEFYYAVDGAVEAQYFYEREQIALKARLYQQALDDIALAIQKEPRETLYHLELASINLRLGRNEEALRAIAHCLTLDATNGEAYRLQGVAYIQLKDKKNSCISLHKAKEYGDPLAQSLIDKYCGE
mgnify:FL=1